MLNNNAYMPDRTITEIETKCPNCGYDNHGIIPQGVETLWKCGRCGQSFVLLIEQPKSMLYRQWCKVFENELSVEVLDDLGLRLVESRQLENQRISREEAHDYFLYNAIKTVGNRTPSKILGAMKHEFEYLWKKYERDKGYPTNIDEYCSAIESMILNRISDMNKLD